MLTALSFVPRRCELSEHGVSLIELMIGLAIFASLLTMAAPGFRDWMQNAQIRNAAQSIQNGLQLARAEAVKRNTQVSFSFTSSVTGSCALSDTQANWVISMGDPSIDLPTKCDSAPSDTDAPRIIQVYDSNDGSPNVILESGQSIIVFNGLGRQGAIAGVTPNPPANIDINVTNPDAGDCAVDNGPMRCLRISVTPSGQIRMCDPKRASTDPQGC